MMLIVIDAIRVDKLPRAFPPEMAFAEIATQK